MKNYLSLVLALLAFSIPAQAIDIGTADQVYVTPHAGGRAVFGQVDLSKSAAVKNQLPSSNGGLGIDASGSTGVAKYSSGTGSVGTVDLSSGSYVANTLGAGNGGTGQTTVLAAFQSFFKSVATSVGDLIIGGSSGTPTRLAIGSTGQLLQVSGGTAVWGPLSATLTAPTQQVFKSNANTITGNLTSGSACIASPSSTTSIVAGAPVYDFTNSGTFASGTYVVGLPGSCTAGQIQVSANAGASHTGDTLVFGGVYTVPTSPSPLYIKIRGIGGGGGGCALSGGTGISGNSGGTTLFDTTTGTVLISAPGGQGGLANTNSSAGGAAPTITSPAFGQGWAGGWGGSGNTTNSVGFSAGGGAPSPFGGGSGQNNDGGSGQSAPENTGSGGQGGSNGAGGGEQCGGGAAGGYFEAQISSPSASYGYFIGYGGALISSTSDGGKGGDGILVITAFYQ